MMWLSFGVAVIVLPMISLGFSVIRQSRVVIPATRTRLLLASSVTGPVYSEDDVPLVTLFTKEGCTLCDKVKDTLMEVRSTHPHSLQQKDITDTKDLFGRYKYDIPVLHVDSIYWTKHKLTQEEAIQGLTAAKEGSFTSPPGEPDASRAEH
jgi:hypothetical protein